MSFLEEDMPELLSMSESKDDIEKLAELISKHMKGDE